MKVHYLTAIFCINLNYYNLSGQVHVEPSLSSKLLPNKSEICTSTNNTYGNFVKFSKGWIYEDFVYTIKAKPNELAKIKNEKMSEVESDLFFAIKYYEDKAGIGSNYEEMNYIDRLMSLNYSQSEIASFFKKKE